MIHNCRRNCKTIAWPCKIYLWTGHCYLMGMYKAISMLICFLLWLFLKSSCQMLIYDILLEEMWHNSATPYIKGRHMFGRQHEWRLHPKEKFHKSFQKIALSPKSLHKIEERISLTISLIKLAPPTTLLWFVHFVEQVVRVPGC